MIKGTTVDGNLITKLWIVEFENQIWLRDSLFERSAISQNWEYHFLR